MVFKRNWKIDHKKYNNNIYFVITFSAWQVLAPEKAHKPNYNYYFATYEHWHSISIYYIDYGMQGLFTREKLAWVELRLPVYGSS